MEGLRQYLIEVVGMTRQARVHGRVIQYRGGDEDTTADFIKFGRGSLGGKARGLAFAQSLVESDEFKQKFPGVNISIPKVAVIGTE